MPVRELLLSGVLELSSSSLLLEWLTASDADDGDVAPSTQSLDGANRAMSALDKALAHLQKSTTFKAMQKSSLSVASALLDVAGRIECHNPFQCLQHAVMFASHGSKLGKSDLPFKKALPSNDLQCSPREALLILGRADCLRALHFTDEAIFLCSYALRMCRLHRQPNAGIGTCDDRTTIAVSPRWGAVSAYAYMVSVAIDSTLTSLLDICGKTATASNWDADALRDMKQGKADAIRIGGDEEFSQAPRADYDGNDATLMNEFDASRPYDSAVVLDGIADRGILNNTVDAGNNNLMELDEQFGGIDADEEEEEQQIAMVAV